MSIWGKIIGAAAGLTVGGPLGALIGAAIGHVVDTAAGRALVPYRATPDEKVDRAQVAFTIGVIALSAKMAKADGRVTDDEIAVFRRLFEVDPAEEANVARVFKLAQQSTLGFEAYARQLGNMFEHNKVVLEDLLDALFQIGGADGVFHPEELRYLEDVAMHFGLSVAQHRRVRLRYLEPDANDPYEILGVTPDATEGEVRNAYRQLVKENHPDQLMAQGVPPEFIRLANGRMAEINEAYNTILKDLEAAL